MQTKKIPPGAIKIALGDVQQPDDYSCGAAAFMAVAAYFGLGPEELEAFKRALGTNSKNGTYYRNIERYAKQLGLKSSTKMGMTRAQLKRLLDRKVPVILSIQAYADDPSKYDDNESNGDGHYVVAIGYDAFNNFYFMDPSLIGRRGFLCWVELNKRWHENEADEGAKPEIHRHLGIVIRPNKHKPVYPNRARKID